MEKGFNLLVISSEHDLESEAEIVTELFSNGLQTFHLRKPRWDLNATKRFVAQVPVEFHSRIVIHSNFEVMEELNLKGIHLTVVNRATINRFTDYEIVSTSFHHLQELVNNEFAYEYVFLSPVFNSLSKTGYHAAFDLNTLEQPLQQSTHKVIALGGVRASNIEQVKEAGFNGAAVLGAVWQSENPVKAFLEIQKQAG